MKITLAELINIANSATHNSEPCTWYSDSFKVNFESTNDSSSFWLFINQEALQHTKNAYEFTLPETNKTIWLQFYKHIVITPKVLLNM